MSFSSKFFLIWIKKRNKKAPKDFPIENLIWKTSSINVYFRAKFNISLYFFKILWLPTCGKEITKKKPEILKLKKYVFELANFVLLAYFFFMFFHCRVYKINDILYSFLLLYILKIKSNKGQRSNCCNDLILRSWIRMRIKHLLR